MAVIEAVSALLTGKLLAGSTAALVVAGSGAAGAAGVLPPDVQVAFDQVVGVVQGDVGDDDVESLDAEMEDGPEAGGAEDPSDGEVDGDPPEGEEEQDGAAGAEDEDAPASEEDEDAPASEEEDGVDAGSEEGEESADGVEDPTEEESDDDAEGRSARAEEVLTELGTRDGSECMPGSDECDFGQAVSANARERAAENAERGRARAEERSHGKQGAEAVEEPVDEGPVDEDPVEEDPVDEGPVDEDPVDEDPVDEGAGPPAGVGKPAGVGR